MGQIQFIERENSGKTNEAWMLPTGSGNVGDEDSCSAWKLPSGMAHRRLRPMQRMAVKESLD